MDRPFIGGVFVLGAELEGGISTIETICHAVTELMGETLKASCALGGRCEFRERDQHGTVGKTKGEGDELLGAVLLDDNIILLGDLVQFFYFHTLSPICCIWI